MEDLWASFNDATDDPYSSSAAVAAAPKKKKVKIMVEYQFVGETVKLVPPPLPPLEVILTAFLNRQEKEVDEDSPEAIAYFSNLSASKPTPPAPSTPTPSTSAIDALFGDSTEPSSAPSTSTVPAPAPPPPKAAPRRPKSSLSSLASSLAKPSKLNTLEKSKLDWSSYVQKEDGLVDDLEKARKGGYLEKMDFVRRTEERAEEERERLKSGRR